MSRPLPPNDAQVVLMDPLQIALIALLPKNGQARTVAELAQAAAVTPQHVTAALFDPYMAGTVDFDVLTDSYSVPRRAQDNQFSSSERKEA